MRSGPSEAMRRAIDLCSNCVLICTETTAHCLEMGEAHATPEHIGMLADCIAVCRAASDLMLRASPHHAEICRVAAEISRACAEDCRGIGPGDEMMARCATTCDRCAEACDALTTPAPALPLATAGASRPVPPPA